MNIAAEIPTIKRILSTINQEIHKGDVTHHHDQFATGLISANFSTKKITNIIVLKFAPTNVFVFFPIFVFILKTIFS